MKTNGLFAAMIAAAFAAPASAQAATYSDAVLVHDPLMYLRMEESSGTVAQDWSPNDRDGTYADPVLGAAGAFVGAGSAVTLGQLSSVAADVNVRTGSVELWVKAARLRKGEQQAFVAHGDPAGDGWSLGVGVKRKLVFITGGKTITSRITIPASSWTMVAVTWDAAKVSFYLNGGSTTKEVSMGGSTPPTSSSGAVQVGGTGFGSFTGAYVGDIDEVALFGRVLTAAEVRDHYNESSLPYNTAAPVVVGTPKDGETFTVQPGSWTVAPTSLAYQWQRCDASGEDCDDVTGATGTSYVLGAGDVGATLQIVETASNGFGTVAVASAPTTVIEALPATGTDAGTTSSGTESGGSQTPTGEGTSSGPCLRLVSGRRRVRVRPLGSLRLGSARDGCIRATAPLRVMFRSRRGIGVRSVRYRLDGKRLRRTRRPAYVASLRPSKLRPGRHVLSVRVTPLKGRAQTATLRLRVAIR